MAGDADHQRAKDQRSDNGRDQPQKDRAQHLQAGAERPEQSGAAIPDCAGRRAGDLRVADLEIGEEFPAGCAVANRGSTVRAPVIRQTREHSHWAGKQSIPWNPQTLTSFDAVLISTHHAAVDYAQLAQHAKLIIDTRNAMLNVHTTPDQVWKA